MERRLVPINQVESNELRVRLKLPQSVRTGRIGIDKQRILEICRISRIEGLFIAGNYLGEGTSLIVANQILKLTKPLNPGEIRIHRVQISHEQFFSSQVFVGLNLDLSGTEKAIQDSERWGGNIHSPEAWAYYINGDLRRKFSKLGKRFLFDDVFREVRSQRSFRPFGRLARIPRMIYLVGSSPLVEAILLQPQPF